MKIELHIPDLNKEYWGKGEKNLDKAVIYSLIKSLGGSISNYKYVSSQSFGDVVDRMKDATKSHDYSDLPQLIIDAQAYWDTLENITYKLINILNHEGFIVCEKCGAVEKICSDTNGDYMPCCGNTEQSEIKDKEK